jgi:hypothetical protein
MPIDGALIGMLIVLLRLGRIVILVRVSAVLTIRYLCIYRRDQHRVLRAALFLSREVLVVSLVWERQNLQLVGFSVPLGAREVVVVWLVE